MNGLSAKEHQQAELAIRKMFEDGCAAWNRADLDAYLAGYWDSDQTVWISGGALRRGKNAIAQAYRTRFSTPRGTGKLTVADLEIEVLTATDASAFGRWILVGDGKEASGFFTVRLRKIDDNWLIVSDHSSSSES